ncbi:MAG: AMIN domain-containing protein [Sulfurimonas sp. RIFOXYD12_FULL_33_39]|uniref:AMIN domain-containing protein n=1 Tax=unclassified Sulfurimonas TaxID=2623549 RepID=UPI0008C0D8E0|nr:MULTISPECIES: AMIN domain-containing protein [unclassified Sulfurimonas]OHE01803.1 MAG: AMIN domain-containing protein [Sulfurimonas sp. RIFCSPLOWO2_12_FULL_34_6]OHE09892.1 MAG: AMIN domain-containing protein [Sulfurimonas sp. RIFOXYD12_FULL_33_39]OHE13600.1 MAG: AMIN domain-containing protein [Sulfurimonas sp. RIFOXYD2_FULL_34_21]DAB28207.1 MAG TPA: AMIN domain-containing protein [Sulfurimonas sp. UBA10385]
MIRILFASLFLLLTMHARENPFFPSAGEKDILLSTNENMAKPSLQRVALNLPPQARTVQKVTIEFKNLDGTLESKSIDLDNSIDWHLPVFISQTYTQAPKEIKSQNSKPENKKSEKTPPENVIKQNTSAYTNIATIKDLSISSLQKSLKLVTKDEMIRNFLLVNPHRIVIDFKKEIDIRSYSKKNPDNIFKEIRIGNHKGYYRVVVELDGYYRYDMQKSSDGYQIELK